jgi:hypothetical protein
MLCAWDADVAAVTSCVRLVHCNTCIQVYKYPLPCAAAFILSTIYQEQVKDPALACPKPHIYNLNYGSIPMLLNSSW